MSFPVVALFSTLASVIAIGAFAGTTEAFVDSFRGTGRGMLFLVAADLVPVPVLALSARLRRTRRTLLNCAVEFLVNALLVFACLFLVGQVTVFFLAMKPMFVSLRV